MTSLMTYSHFIGSKNDIDLYNNLIKENLPNHIETYIEPFGGSFGLTKLFENRPNQLIYNDLQIHDVELFDVDEIHHKDYSDILDKYDSKEAVFYLDPPYYGKEHIYNGKRYDIDFHERLRENVKNREGKILISYEDNSFIRNLYEGEVIKSYSGDNPSKKKEILICL